MATALCTVSKRTLRYGVNTCVSRNEILGWSSHWPLSRTDSIRLWWELKAAFGGRWFVVNFWYTTLTLAFLAPIFGLIYASQNLSSNSFVSFCLITAVMHVVHVQRRRCRKVQPSDRLAMDRWWWWWRCRWNNLNSKVKVNSNLTGLTVQVEYSKINKKNKVVFQTGY